MKHVESMPELSVHGLSLYDLGDDLVVAQKNHSETQFLYDEIWHTNAYLGGGIEIGGCESIVDVGANIGMFALYAARRAPRCRIVAIEPVEELCAAIRYNATLHGADVTVIQAAIGAAAGDITFNYYPNNTVMSAKAGDELADRALLQSYIQSKGAVDDLALLHKIVADRLRPERRAARVMTLSEIIEAQHLERIDLLKIDVERAELAALQGIAGHHWPRVAQVAVEVHDVDTRVDDVRHLLATHGFNVSLANDSAAERTGCRMLFAVRRTAGLTVPREASAAPAREAIAAPSSPPEAPQREMDAIEAAIAAIWSGIFRDRTIALDDDFFLLGGNSLSAIRLVSRIEKQFGAGALPLDRLFADGTLRGMASAIRASVAQPTTSVIGAIDQ